MEKNFGEKLYNLVIRYNETVNITAITGYDDFILKHIKDSELGEKYIEGNNILDIGSGAGFPGIVFALNDKNKTVLMVDSVNKKINVINSILHELEINNAYALHIRIEDLKDKEKFDTVTARAVAPLRTLVEYALPFIKIGGVMVAYKAVESEEEINEAKDAVKELGGKIEKVKDEELALGIMRRFVIIRKIKPSPKIYPRGKNLPRLKPL